ncbi:MAG: hypothetical protein DMF34_02410, partial [Verrucomicrobia bacterium]
MVAGWETHCFSQDHRAKQLRNLCSKWRWRELHNLTNHPAFDGWPSWSPDGTKIAFGSNRNSNYQIFIMNAQ